MNIKIIREIFFDFFQKKNHTYKRPSFLVNKDDPNLMFTNAGMNQFKNIFLDQEKITERRLVNSQLCLRISGKHNDLSEVGNDTYHHTLFEMLGNWSMNDYFKEEAISFAWELLVDVYKIDKDRLYVTIFEGDKQDNLNKDEDSYNIWQRFISKDRIILCSKHDNFWEMGETGPCGPCTEIHIDIRSDEERNKIDGKLLVNKNNPEVIELWNIVFIQYERLGDKSLKELNKHFIDTGMGLERLAMVLQNKKSDYDTDIFIPYISAIETLSGLKYDNNEKINVAIRVIADHIRAIVMTIAEGLIPSNIQEGYVIRRLIRRAVRYGYSYLNIKEPFLYKLTYVVFEQFECFKDNITLNIHEVENIILTEEKSFFKTLKDGMKRLEIIINTAKNNDKDIVSGKIVFELYDTYGFPVDLTKMILYENNLSFDCKEFEKSLEEQKNRSRNVAKVDKGDWKIINEGNNVFVGYDIYECKAKILKYRHVKENDKEYYQIVFSKTPFYGESGGQVGDTGYISCLNDIIDVFDTKKEFDDILHCVYKIPDDISTELVLKINIERRNKISANHSCTHILQASLKKLFDENIKQCGSKVDDTKLRFDFNYEKSLDKNDLLKLENFIKDIISKNLQMIERRDIPFEEVKKENIIALFENKYKDSVRIIEFDGFSKELCCGTHVKNTNYIKFFKIIKCKNISNGIKRVEAITNID